jgi:hypothetical protein
MFWNKTFYLVNPVHLVFNQIWLKTCAVFAVFSSENLETPVDFLGIIDEKLEMTINLLEVFI